MTTSLLGNVFLLSLLFIFLSAFVGTFVKRRSRDRCLADFRDFHVTVELKGGRQIWGRLAVYPDSLEVVYAQPHRSDEGYTQTSYVILQGGLPDIQAVYRVHSELTPTRQAQRLAEIRRTYHPNPVRRARRSTRNFFNTFRDAFNQAFSLALTQAKKTSHSVVFQAEDAQLQQIGTSLLGVAANAYEPILERYIGCKVVAEAQRGDAWQAYAGILKDYTAAWLELLDCELSQQHAFALRDPARLRLDRDLGGVLRVIPAADGRRRLEIAVENQGAEPVRIVSLQRDGYEEAIDRVLGPGERADIAVDDLPQQAWDGSEAIEAPQAVPLVTEESVAPAVTGWLPDVEIKLEARRRLDVCLPRTLAVVRHGGEQI
jgi:hypothetical protein